VFVRSKIHAILAALGLLSVCSCGWDGHFTLLGYSTRSNHDPSIRTVHVPVFKNVTFWRGLEFELTEAVVREIQAKTPYRVESDPDRADTELLGTVVNLNKNILNRNQLNEVREAETVLAVEVIWRDRRTGEVLSRPRPPGGPPLGMPLDSPPVPIEAPGLPALPAPPTLVQSVGGFIPELGGSISSARKENVDRLAVHIVSLMERPW
jgi:hypothetical protein